MWFFVAFLGYLLLAIVFILDKFILSKSTSKPAVYTFYSTIFLFAAILAWPFGVKLLVGNDWWLAILSGISFGFGLWTFFIALEKGEASHISPFNGAIISVATYLFSSYFLGEKLTELQMMGIAVLAFASFLLSFEKSKQHSGFHIGFVWAILSGIFFATSHVSAKYIYSLYPFLTGFVWTRFFTGLVGLCTLFIPSVRQILFQKQKNKTDSKKNVISIIVLDKILAVVSVVLIQYASAIGSVSLVIAMSGSQFVLMFIMIFLLTKFTPKLFKEFFTKRELIVQVIALLLVAAGSALFVI